MLNDKLDKIGSTVEIAEKKKFKCSECEYEATSERCLKATLEENTKQTKQTILKLVIFVTLL